METAKHQNRLSEANTALKKFKDVSRTLLDYDALLVILATHHDMLQRKVTLCNEKLSKLHSSIEDVATKENGWTMTKLAAELEKLDTLCENLYRGFQEWLREYEVQELKRENLEAK